MKQSLLLFLACGALTAMAMRPPCVRLSFDDPNNLASETGGLGLTFSTTGRLRYEPRGVSGGCAFCDGKSWLAATSLPDGFPTGKASVTVSTWVRAAPTAGRSDGWVSWGDKATGRGNSLRFHGPDKIHNYWNNRDLTVSAIGVGDGRWHHVVAVADARGRRAVYLDGFPCGQDAAAPDTGKGIFLVGKTMHDAAFRGWIDEVTLWPCAFSDDEVFDLFKAELSREVFSNEPLAPTLRERPIAATPEQIGKDGFTATITVDVTKPSDRAELLYSAGPARLILRPAGSDKALLEYDRRAGNYLNFPLADGSCPILEATLAPKAARVGIPLGCLKQQSGRLAVTLQYVAPRWCIRVEDAIDEAFPIPAFPVVWPNDAVEKIHSPRVADAALATPARADALPAVADARQILEPIQYWTPPGHNTWVGDVAPAYLNGRMHVFYLIDRRHHGGGNGTGRHQFAHLTSDDLVTWVEHPLAVPILEEWQTCGTGTPFLKDGKVALAFGWHTSRYPECKGKPLGGTYAISDDGIHFRNAGTMISDAQNPSIYNLADGRYELVTSYGGSIGIFHSSDLLDWKLYDDKLPFRGDCPSLFDWHGHRYLLQGFFHFAFTPDGTPGSFVDWTSQPDALYEGLSVPMVASWKNDRRLYMGWLRHLYGWGGWLVFREVVAFDDGHLGLKWVPEIKPPTPPRTFYARGGERFALRLAPKQGAANAVLLTVDPATQTASFLDDTPNAKPDQHRANAVNVVIGGVRGLDRDYAVRLIVHYDAKADATIFDAEIAGTRTLICRRAGRYVAER